MGFYSNYYGEGYLVLLFVIILNYIRIINLRCFMANLGGILGGVQLSWNMAVF